MKADGGGKERRWMLGRKTGKGQGKELGTKAEGGRWQEMEINGCLMKGLLEKMKRYEGQSRNDSGGVTDGSLRA